MITRILIPMLFMSWVDALAMRVQDVPPHRAEAVDTLVRVGGHALHFVVHRGELPITVVFEAGGASNLTSWRDVPQRIAARTGATVVAYDRAGLGGSSLPHDDLTPTQEIRDLHFGLDQLAVPKATILVATSYGAMLAFLNAARFGDEVVGLVLVDPMNARFAQATGDFLASTAPDIPNPVSDRERVIARMNVTFPALVEEVATLEPGLPQPMAVITAGEAWWGREDIDKAWRRSHEDLAAAGVRRQLIVAEGSGHDVPRERPDVILSAVEQMVTSLSR
jgi:pimeloyl-ACP methyl ester carboxylesterase